MKVAQSCPILCNPIDYTVRVILQARMLEWVAFPFSRKSSQPWDWTPVSCTAGRFFTSWATREAQQHWSGKPIPSPADLPDPGLEPRSPAVQTDSLPTELSGNHKGSPQLWKTAFNYCPFLQHQKHSIFELLSSISLWPLLPLLHHWLWLQPPLSP